jgi:hypothetical protein
MIKEVGACRDEERTKGGDVWILRDAKVDEGIGLFGCTRSMKGHICSFWCTGSKRNVTHPEETTISEGEVWSPYKRTRVHNQEGTTRRER